MTFSFSIPRSIICGENALEHLATLKGKKVSLTITAEAMAWIAKKGYSKEFGARPLGRVIQEWIGDKLASEILFGALKGGGRVDIDCVDGALTFLYGDK